MRKSTALALFFILLCVCAIFTTASYLSIVEVNREVVSGHWFQGLITRGNVRLVWVQSVGPRSADQQFVFGEYKNFWRISGDAERLKWKMTEVFGDDRKPIVRDWRLDLAVWSTMVSGILLVVIIAKRRVFARSLIELWRPRNMTDVRHPWRRWTRKTFWAAYFALAVLFLNTVNRGRLPLANRDVSWNLSGRTLMDHVGGWTLLERDEENDRKFWSIDFANDQFSFGFYKSLPAMTAIEPLNLEFSGVRYVRGNEPRWKRHLMDAQALDESFEQSMNMRSSFLGLADARGTIEYVGGWRIELQAWVVLLLIFMWPILAYLRGPLRRAWWRKDGRCGVCGYNLSGNINGVCTECGSNIDLNAFVRPKLDVRMPVNLNEVEFEHASDSPSASDEPNPPIAQ